MPNLNQQLLPCPMCGGTAQAQMMDENHMVMCHDCGVNYEGPTADDCATAWNRRQHGSAAQAVECAACLGMGYDDVGDERPAAGSACSVCKGSGKAAPPVADAAQIKTHEQRLKETGYVNEEHNCDLYRAEIAELRTLSRRPAAAPEATLRHWTEDFAHDNGNYMNTCSTCNNTFMGYKRRVTCKLCAEATPGGNGAAGSVAAEEPAAVMEAVYGALRSYLLTNANYSEEEGGGNYALVDLLTPDGRSIGEGEEEMRCIAHDITDAVAAHLSAAGKGSEHEMIVLGGKRMGRNYLAGLEADKTRLDWIEARGNGCGWIARESGSGRGYRLHNQSGAPHDTARKAIDAAAIDAAKAKGEQQ